MIHMEGWTPGSLMTKMETTEAASWLAASSNSVAGRKAVEALSTKFHLGLAMGQGYSARPLLAHDYLSAVIVHRSPPVLLVTFRGRLDIDIAGEGDNPRLDEGEG
jgi:hypothetical protein